MSTIVKDAFQHISDAKLREQMAEHLWGVETYAHTAVRFLELGDDKGAEYSVKRAAADMQAAADFLIEIKRRAMEQQKEEYYAQQRPVRIGAARRDGVDAAREGRTGENGASQRGGGELGDDPE